MKIKLMLMLCVAFLLIGSRDIWAAPADGCSSKKVAGSYTRSAVDPDLGKVFVDQLNFDGDGTLYWNWTGSLELPITLGIGSPYVGSWKCLRDGNLLLTVIVGSYAPNGSGDVELSNYFRLTMVYTLDGDTLKRVKRVRRCYLPTEDPTDPAGVPGCGTSYSESAYDFTRLNPLDSDFDGFPAP